MRVLIMYHSGCGTTEAVARSFVERLKPHAVTCREIGTGEPPEPDGFDVLGVMSWTWFLGLPPAMETFLDGLPSMPGKPAFILTTYGMMPGRALKFLETRLAAKGFIPAAAFAFHTPESYPVYIGKGWGAPDSPDDQELAGLHAFTDEVVECLETVAGGKNPSAVKIVPDLFSRLVKPYDLRKARRTIGTLSADPEKCSACGTCAEVCPYSAVRMEGVPVFDPEACTACWTCFNRCPGNAVRSSKWKGMGRYPGPTKVFLEKISR